MKLWPEHYNPPCYPKYNFLERTEFVTGVPIKLLRSNKRYRQLARVRWAIAHVMRDKLGRSYPEIGNSLGVHHASIIHGIKQSRQLLNCCERHRALVSSLELLA